MDLAISSPAPYSRSESGGDRRNLLGHHVLHSRQLFTRRGQLGDICITVFLLAGAVGLAYIPGIFIDIRRLREKD